MRGQSCPTAVLMITILTLGGPKDWRHLPLSSCDQTVTMHPLAHRGKLAISEDLSL